MRIHINPHLATAQGTVWVFPCVLPGPPRVVGGQSQGQHPLELVQPSESRKLSKGFSGLTSSCNVGASSCIRMAAPGFFKDYFIHFLAVLGLPYCRGFFFSCEEWAFSLVVMLRLLLLQSTDSRARGHGALGHRLSSCRDTGSVAPRRMGSSRIRDQSRASCLGRWTPYH